MPRSIFYHVRLWSTVAAVAVCVGCATVPQTYKSLQHRSYTLAPQDLEINGVAFITPSTVTGQEEEKQAVASLFTEVLSTNRPDIPLMTLPQTLSAVNRAGIELNYTKMFEDYRNTGLFKVDSLRDVGKATNKRYLAQLKLSGFSQGSDGRFGVFGLRLIKTQTARLRLSFQIWDSHDGSIAWEAMEELEYSEDTMMERTITLKTIMEKAATDLVECLPSVPGPSANAGRGLQSMEALGKK
jgi:DUF971 family protein